MTVLDTWRLSDFLSSLVLLLVKDWERKATSELRAYMYRIVYKKNTLIRFETKNTIIFITGRDMDVNEKD